MRNEIIASARIWPNFPYATPKNVANEIAEKNARGRPTKGQPKFFSAITFATCFGVASGKLHQMCAFAIISISCVS